MQTYYAYLKADGVTTTVPGVTSKTNLNVPYYKGQNNRNVFGASDLGNAHIQASADGVTETTDALYNQSDDIAGRLPFNELFQRTRIYLWSGGGGNPVLLAAVALTGPITLGAVALTINSTTLTCTSTTGVVAGDSLTGAGIVPGTTVVSVGGGGTTLVMSNAATLTSSGTTAVASNPFLTCTSTTGVHAGDTVVGIGIPTGTLVLSVVSGTVLLLSAPATTTLSGGSAMINGTGDVLFEEWLDNVALSVGPWTQV